MTDERFQELLDELIGGLPVTMIVTRLALAVRYLVEPAPDAAAPERFENFVAQYREDSEDR